MCPFFTCKKNFKKITSKHRQPKKGNEKKRRFIITLLDIAVLRRPQNSKSPVRCPSSAECTMH